jgi:hypothetical protein
VADLPNCKKCGIQTKKISATFCKDCWMVKLKTGRKWNHCKTCDKQLKNYHTEICRICWVKSKEKTIDEKRIYKIWQNMKRRCDVSSVESYGRYGGRGITYDPGWKKFENFKQDMGDSYKHELTLDRIDNNDNYFKENCRWATRTQQARNTKNIEQAKRYTFNGITKTIRDWSEEIGIKRSTLDMRLNVRKWSVEKSLLTPVQGGGLYL